MAVAAAETGVKEFISSVSPDASWLLENIQSPPLDKILSHYLPTLPSRKNDCTTVPALPKGWRKILLAAVEARNRIVHGRIVELDQDQIATTLDTVLEFLYFLDQHAGYSWASEHRFVHDNLT